MPGASRTCRRRRPLRRATGLRHLGGHSLISSTHHLRGSAVWMNFPRVICERWFHENVVLMGDAAATGHFSIGSGTRLAFDNAIALAELLHTESTRKARSGALPGRAAARVLRLQSAAQQPRVVRAVRALPRPASRAVQLLTAHQVATHLAREPATARSGMAALGGGLVPGAGGRDARPGADVRALRGMELINRVVVSPMAQYKAVDGCPTDWRFVHYAERAKRGCGPRLHRDDVRLARGPHHADAPGCTPRARGGMAAAHDVRARRDRGQDLLPDRPSGRKGSTQLGWEEISGHCPMATGR